MEASCTMQPAISLETALTDSNNNNVDDCTHSVQQVILPESISKRNSNGKKFTVIKKNKAVPPMQLKASLKEVDACECNPNDPNPCSEASQCLNRTMFCECHSKVCPAGERCENRMFESRKYAKLNVVEIPNMGFGVIAQQFIAQGTFIIEYVGEVISNDELQRRVRMKKLRADKQFYFMLINRETILDCEFRGNNARFINHSCDPNCEAQKWLVKGLERIGVFALKDIPSKTEITINYNWHSLNVSENIQCLCGAENCAGYIGGKSKSNNHAEAKTIS